MHNQRITMITGNGWVPSTILLICTKSETGPFWAHYNMVCFPNYSQQISHNCPARAKCGMFFFVILKYCVSRLVQIRHNSSVLAMELHLSCTNPSVYIVHLKLPCSILYNWQCYNYFTVSSWKNSEYSFIGPKLVLNDRCKRLTKYRRIAIFVHLNYL